VDCADAPETSFTLRTVRRVADYNVPNGRRETIGRHSLNGIPGGVIGSITEDGGNGGAEARMRRVRCPNRQTLRPV